MTKRAYTVSDAVRAKNSAAGKARHPEPTQDWTSVRVPRSVAGSAQNIKRKGEPVWRVIEAGIALEAEARGKMRIH